MHWALLLHFYQPYGQRREIVDSIAGQTYNPIMDGILAARHGRITINLTGSLLDLLDEYGHQELIEKFVEAGRQGLVEYVTTAKYHAILPMLPANEIKRQIEINNETCRKYLGKAFNPRGIFLPEMAYDPKIVAVLGELGLDWVLLDELAYDGRIDSVDYHKTYQIEGSNVKALFREHRLSDTLMSAGARTPDRFKAAIGPEIHSKRYVVTAMDGETFGHHRVGMEQLLFAMLADKDIEMVQMSELLALYPETKQVKTVACTWASNEADLTEHTPFISWNEPGNELHALQWQLVNLAVAEMAKLPQDDPDYTRLRTELDPALASDQFFWASGRPWWMIDFIEGGAYRLLSVIQHLPTTPPDKVEEALHLYHQIVGTAFDWQRNGHLERLAKQRDEILRIPFKERTHDLEGEGKAVWKAFIHIMQEQEKAAAKRTDYEAAAMWRDAAYKLEQKTDIYDGYHVIDILRAQLGDPEVDMVIQRFTADYNRIRGGQSEQRSH